MGAPGGDSIDRDRRERTERERSENGGGQDYLERIFLSLSLSTTRNCKLWKLQ